MALSQVLGRRDPTGLDRGGFFLCEPLQAVHQALPLHELEERSRQFQHQVPQDPPQAVCWGYRPVDVRNLNNQINAPFLKSRNALQRITPRRGDLPVKER